MPQKVNYSDLWQAKLKSSLMFIILICLLGLLIMVSAQETFKDVLIPLGLYHDRSGALIECSKPGSERSKYCGGVTEEPVRERKFSKDPRDTKGFDLF